MKFFHHNFVILVKDPFPGEIKVDRPLQQTQISEGQKCCERKGVSKLCLGFCDKADDKGRTISRGLFRCSDYKKEIETCRNGNLVNICE